MEFPFEPSLLAGEERDRLKRSQDAAVRRSAALRDAPIRQGVLQTISVEHFNAAIVESASTTSSDTASRSTISTQFRDHRRLVIASGAVLTLLTCVIGLQAFWSRLWVSRIDRVSAAPTPSTLVTGLHAKRDSTDVEITWNREAPVVVAATSGVLSITDGNIKRDIAFDATQMRNSSVVYSPTSDRLSIRLSITTAASTINESIMLLLPNYIPTNQVTLQIPELPASRSLKPFIPPSPVGATATDAGLLPLPPLTPGPPASPNLDSFPL